MKIIVSFLFIVMTAGLLQGQDYVMSIWPSGPPTDNGLIGPEVDEGNNRVSNISIARLYVYLPEKEKNTGAAVILLPGGGYRREAMSHEGYEVAEWLKSKGITGVVLKYRLPNGHPDVPMEDAARAIRYIRYYAEEWGIDPGKVGIGGASAGGHLASTAGTRYQTITPDPDDKIDKFSSRPDFMLLLYPAIFFEEGKVNPRLSELFFGGDTRPETLKKYSSNLNVTEDTPPAFIVLADNDRAVNPLHSVRFYTALKEHNVPAEMHIFYDGGHGFGITRQNLPSDQWPDLFYSWMKSMKIIE